ncbi:hypothetical protein PshuTeo2_05760 [Pseudomonas hunanensis]|nr:hypothetical protein [Pseudomonas hunanensis]
MQTAADYEDEMLLKISRATEHGPVGIAIERNPAPDQKPHYDQVKLCLNSLVKRGLLNAFTCSLSRSLRHDVTRSGWLHLRSLRKRRAV